MNKWLVRPRKFAIRNSQFEIHFIGRMLLSVSGYGNGERRGDANRVWSPEKQQAVSLL
jgi:hypothetical protein